MLRHAEWTVLISDDVEVWLLHCHPEKGERARIIARFRHTFDLLRAFGPAIGKPHIDRIEGEENLWEVRVGAPHRCLSRVFRTRDQRFSHSRGLWRGEEAQPVHTSSLQAGCAAGCRGGGAIREGKE